ncbi:MAG: hypothetical protein HY722_06110 [Planctomycetes bacterium]|nr:hypothetical protein [Planctomycetota bacterium]
MICETCGSRSFREREVDGFLALECQLCGEVEADRSSPTAVDRHRELEERQSLGVEDGIWPLVKALRAIDAVETYSSCEGHATHGTLPYVYFRIDDPTVRSLERLVLALDLACRKARLPWGLDVTVDRNRVAYLLRPRGFGPHARVDAATLERGRADVAPIAEELTRNTRLAWFLDF